MHINPDELSDEEWAWTIKYLIDIRKIEREVNNGKRT